jgi:hypothetical protein
MNSAIHRTITSVFVIGLLLLGSVRSHGIINAINDVESVLANLKGTTNFAEVRAVILHAQKVIDEGRAEVARLQKEQARWQEEKKNLEFARSLLGTGFLAALLGAFVGYWQKANSKAERLLKELDLIERIAKLKAAGIDVPSEIEKKYSPKRAV